MDLSKKIIVSVIVIIILIISSMFLVKNPAIDPVEAIAVVNGSKIQKEQFEFYVNQNISSHGIDTTNMDFEKRKQIEQSVLNMLISQELLYQAANQDRIELTNKELEANFKAIKSQYPEEEFARLLSLQNYTEETFKQQIYKDLTTQKYLDKKIKDFADQITIEEIEEAYELLLETEELGEIEDHVEEIKDFILTKNNQKIVNQILEEVKASSQIEILI